MVELIIAIASGLISGVVYAALLILCDNCLKVYEYED